MAANTRPTPDPTVTWTRIAPDALDLAGKKAAVIGGTGGLGRALARLLAARGAHVTVVGRTFRDAGVANLEFVQADLSLMSETARVADELPAEELDLLVLTTGIFAAPQRQETPEGYERDLAVSYLNRLVLLRRLADRLGTARPADAPAARVFVMGFPGTGQDVDVDDLNAERSYKSMQVHLGTVAANEALVIDAAGRHPHLRAYGLNPGLVKTDIRANMYGGSKLRQKLMEGMIGLFSPTAEQYADRIVPLLVAPDLDAYTGAMFNGKGHAIRRSPNITDARATEIVDASEALLRRITPDTIEAR